MIRIRGWKRLGLVGLATTLIVAVPAAAQSTSAQSGSASAASNTSNTSTIDFSYLSYYLIDGEFSQVSFSLFPGSFTSPLDGELVLRIPDPSVPVPASDMRGVSVKRAAFLATNWDPANNFLAEPQVLFLDPRHRSNGWIRPDGSIRLVVYLTDTCGGPPVPMPLILKGHVGDASIRLRGTNGNVADGTMSVEIHAYQDLPRREVRFSTEVGFPVASSSGASAWVSDGDLLSTHDCVVRTNHDLTANLGIMPIAPDVGLDAVTFSAYRPVMFSIEESIWSETLGRLGHGDLLCATGQIVRTNAELTARFGPSTAVAEVGLDAIHIPTGWYANSTTAACCNCMLFSVEDRFFSTVLNRWIGHGDLLCTCGTVFRTNRQLLANFDPIAVPCLSANACPDFGPCEPYEEPTMADLVPCTSNDPTSHCVDFGLDGVYLRDRGEIWFSTERGFWDANLGWVGAGDLLSDRGYIVRRNPALVDVCGPLANCRNYGLDALDWAGPQPMLAPTNNAAAILPGGGD